MEKCFMIQIGVLSKPICVEKSMTFYLLAPSLLFLVHLFRLGFDLFRQFGVFDVRELLIGAFKNSKHVFVHTVVCKLKGKTIGTPMPLL
jgi:hypothetical protein